MSLGRLLVPPLLALVYFEVGAVAEVACDPVPRMEPEAGMELLHLAIVSKWR